MRRRDFNAGVLAGGALAAGGVLRGMAAVPSTAGSVAGAPGGCGDALVADDLRVYLAAFNRDDFEGFGRFYAPDILFEGQGGRFTSRDQVLAFYRDVKTRVRETITINDIVAGDGELFADLTTELVAIRDFPGLATGAMRAGDVRRSQNFIWYRFSGRQFVHVRSANYRRL
jgi:hypothetical protein